MTDPREDPHALISAYLDGALPVPARAELERRLRSDPALRDELDLQSKIDGRLRVLFDPPAVPPAASGVPARGRRWPGPWRAAAALLLVTLGVWALAARPWNGLLGPAPSQVAADAVYQRLVRTGFEPVWVCENEEKFALYTRDSLGRSFVVRPQAGVTLVGWTYADGVLGEQAKVLLATAGADKVVVFMDQKTHDRRVHTGAGAGLNVFRQELGDVVMYEVSPRDRPVVVNSVLAR